MRRVDGVRRAPSRCGSQTAMLGHRSRRRPRHTRAFRTFLSSASYARMDRTATKKWLSERTRDKLGTQWTLAQLLLPVRFSPAPKEQRKTLCSLRPIRTDREVAAEIHRSRTFHGCAATFVRAPEGNLLSTTSYPFVDDTIGARCSTQVRRVSRQSGGRPLACPLSQPPVWIRRDKRSGNNQLYLWKVI